MSIASVFLLPPLNTTIGLDGTAIDAVLTRTGANFPGPGTYGHTDGLITISMKLSNFRGRVYIEGSLVDSPAWNTDWFPLPSSNQDGYFQFPSDQYPSSINAPGYSGIFGFTFNCNCLWLRARTDQTYLFTPGMWEILKPIQIAQYGFVDNILANYSTIGYGAIPQTEETDVIIGGGTW